MSLTSLEPESSASANSAISANHWNVYYYSTEICICQHFFEKKFIFLFFFFSGGYQALLLPVRCAFSGEPSAFCARCIDVYKRQDMVCHEIEDIIGIPALDAPRISAKTGLNVEQVLERIVTDLSLIHILQSGRKISAAKKSAPAPAGKADPRLGTQQHRHRPLLRTKQALEGALPRQLRHLLPRMGAAVAAADRPKLTACPEKLRTPPCPKRRCCGTIYGSFPSSPASKSGRAKRLIF